MNWNQRLNQLSQQRREQNLWRQRMTAESPQGRLIRVGSRELLNFCSNDYLGLANHPALIQAGIEALEKWGVGSGASHLVCGHNALHDQLETELAALVGAEKSLLFSTGYMANLALPQTFLGRSGLLIEDKLNHASMIDAGSLSPATMKRYPHLDSLAAAKLFEESTSDQKMLMTDGVFSMDGDVAPVDDLNRICQQHDALLVVDDAHGFGVLGASGGGILQQQQIPIAKHVLMMGTLGKSAGSFGAFVAGDAELIEAMIQFARPYIYTTALPAAVVAASLAAIDIIRHDVSRREKLLANIDYFRAMAIARGCRLSSSRTPIQPILINDTQRALLTSRRLLDAGIWVAAIRPPTVPVGSDRLRVTLTASHTNEDIDRLVAVLVIGKR